MFFDVFRGASFPADVVMLSDVLSGPDFPPLPADVVMLSDVLSGPDFPPLPVVMFSDVLRGESLPEASLMGTRLAAEYESEIAYAWTEFYSKF